MRIAQTSAVARLNITSPRSVGQHDRTFPSAAAGMSTAGCKDDPRLLAAAGLRRTFTLNDEPQTPSRTNLANTKSMRATRVVLLAALSGNVPDGRSGSTCSAYAAGTTAQTMHVRHSRERN